MDTADKQLTASNDNENTTNSATNNTLGKAVLLIAILMNLAVTVLAFIGAVTSFRRNGAGMLQYYTVESNLFGAAACAIMAVLLLRKMISGKEVPAWAAILKYMSVCCLSLTFLVVVTILAPMNNGMGGYRALLTHDDMLYLHLLCPVLAFVSFLLFDNIPFRTIKMACISLIPTVCYAAVTTTLNVIRVMVGPYPFLYVYEQPLWMSFVWFMLIFGGAFAIGAFLARVKQVPGKSKGLANLS